MKLEFIQPRKELKPFISKIWLFENNNGLVNHGTLIAPNAKAKIIIPYINTLTTTDNKKTAVCGEGDIYFIGIRDVPVTLGTPQGATGSIGIELTTSGAYRFLKSPMYHLTNNLFSFYDLYGKEGKELMNLLQDEQDPKMKIKLVQEFLFHQMVHETRNNLLIDYSVNFISSLHGLATIKQLEQKTGYSKRYLDMLFKEYLGISPKTYATIARFQHFYKFSQNVLQLTNGNIYDLYYDQSHFIKEFKRYTGYTPMQYSKFNNDFGKHF
jgi:AraC-like DNA-binding protein